MPFGAAAQVDSTLQSAAGLFTNTSAGAGGLSTFFFYLQEKEVGSHHVLQLRATSYLPVHTAQLLCVVLVTKCHRDSVWFLICPHFPSLFPRRHPSRMLGEVFPVWTGFSPLLQCIAICMSFMYKIIEHWYHLYLATGEWHLSRQSPSPKLHSPFYASPQPGLPNKSQGRLNKAAHNRTLRRLSMSSRSAWAHMFQNNEYVNMQIT